MGLPDGFSGIYATRHRTVTGSHKTPQDVLNDKIPTSWQVTEIIQSIMNHNMNLDAVREFLKNYPEKNATNYRKIL